MATTGIEPDAIRRWPSSDFAAMQALYSVEPWGANRDNAHAAMLATLYAGAHTPRGKRRPRMSDYMLTTKAANSDKGKLQVLRHYLESTVKQNG